MTQGSGIGHLSDPNDPWAMAQAGYSPDKFYVRATDGKGHSENVQTKISPSLLGELSAIIAAKEIPEYRTVQDFIRDAVLHRAKYVAELLKRGTLAQKVDAEMVLSSIEGSRKMRREQEAIVSTGRDELADLIRVSNYGAYSSLVEELDSVSDMLMEPYGSQLATVVHEARLAAARQRRSEMRAG